MQTLKMASTVLLHVAQRLMNEPACCLRTLLLQDMMDT